MSRLKIAAVAVAGLLTFGVAAVFAQDAFVAPATPEAAVAAREGLMKSNGALLKTAGGLSGPEAVTAMQTLLGNFTNMAAVFPEGSNVGDSKASPDIWQNWDAFTAIIETGKTAATAAVAAAETGDATAYGAALKAMGGTCGTCHQQFRLK